MKLYLREITDRGLELSFDQNEKWLAEAVLQADESDESDSSDLGSLIQARRQKNKKTRSIRFDLTANRLDGVFILSGKIDTSIHLICSRCAAAFEFPLRQKFSALYSKDPVMAGLGESGTESTRSYARHAHDEDSESQDMDITYLTEDFIHLNDLVMEQIQLKLPFRPLCSESCQGVCATCGTNLNTGKCACSKINAHSPFAVLSQHKPGTPH